MSDYRFAIVKRNEIDCLHVMIDSNSLQEIADTHIPLDDIEAAIERYNVQPTALLEIQSESNAVQ